MMNAAQSATEALAYLQKHIPDAYAKYLEFTRKLCETGGLDPKMLELILVWLAARSCPNATYAFRCTYRAPPRPAPLAARHSDLIPSARRICTTCGVAVKGRLGAGLVAEQAAITMDLYFAFFSIPIYNRRKSPRQVFRQALTCSHKENVKWKC